MKTICTMTLNRVYSATKTTKTFTVAAISLFIVYQIMCYVHAENENEIGRRMFIKPRNISSYNKSIDSEESVTELHSIHASSTSPPIVIDDGAKNPEQANLSRKLEAKEGSINISWTSPPKVIDDGAKNPEQANLSRKLEAKEGSINISIIVLSDGARNPEQANLSRMLEAKEGSSKISSKPPLMIDLSNLSFVIFNNVCSNDTHLPILAVMMITSHAGNAIKRDAIREAYPTSEMTTLGIRRVFLLATLANNTEPDSYYESISQERLSEENRFHKDILQLNLIEAYTNLTYKNLMGLKYVATYCTSAQFVIKMDDDTIYDVYQLVDVLKSVKLVDWHNLVGDLIVEGDVDRDGGSEYYVPETQYAHKLYPHYLRGYFSFTSIKTASKLVETSKLVPFISVEDALITGIAAERAGVQRYQLDGLSEATLNCCRDVANTTMSRCEFVAALQWDYDEELLLKISRHSAKCYYSKNCKQKIDLESDTRNITCF